MSLGLSTSILRQRGQKQLQRNQAKREAEVLRLKKELAAAVEYLVDDPALDRAVARLDAKGRVEGVDYEVVDMPPLKRVLKLPVGHRNIDAPTSS